MADLFSVTAPLAIRRLSGQRAMMAERFRHPRGLLYFDLFRHLADPADAVHLMEGAIRGEGPWKIGDCVAQVPGCQGTDAEPAQQVDQWRHYLRELPTTYPACALIESIARRHGIIDCSPSPKKNPPAAG